MTARRDPARTVAVLLPALVAAALIPFLVRSAYRTVTTSTQGQSQPTAPRSAQLPETPAHLLVVDDDQGVPVGAAVLAVAPGGRGGAVVVVPLGTRTLDATGAPVRLDAGAADGGLDRLAADVEGLLGITLAGRARLGTADLASVLAPVTPVTTTLVDAVRSVGPDGSEVLVRAAGPATLSAAEAAAVLTARGDESEVVRVDRAVELWRSLVPVEPRTVPAPAVPAPAAPGAATAGVEEARTLVAALAAGRTVVRPVPVTPDDVPADGPERFVADPVWLRLLMAEIVPSAVSPADASLRVRVRNPSGDEEVAYRVVAALLAVPANVILVDNTPGGVPDTSALTYADPTVAPALPAVVTALGALAVATTDERIDGIDATITVGTDLVATARRVGPATATTAVPPTSTGAGSPAPGAPTAVPSPSSSPSSSGGSPSTT